MVGHDAAWREWRAALAAGRMHHAWILAGRQGLGKASFARAAAVELVAEPGGQALAPEAHPDILLLAPTPAGDEEERKRDDGKPFKLRRNITVDEVRALQRRLTTRPTLGARRAVIIDAADDLEPSAFNALLKTLEEPGQGTVLLLVAHRLGRLPATIRSRCRVLRFGDLDAASLGKVLAAAEPGLSPAVSTAAQAAAAGAPGAALAFVARDLAAAQALMARMADSGDANFALRGALLDAVGQRPDRERQLAVLETARMVLVVAAAGAERERQGRIVEAHAALSQRIAQAPTHNFDPATLVFEIGGLLASVGDPRDAAG
ncbi:MAG: DNA polymerase III subunit delta' [Novosphingobium sp.]